MALFHSIPAMCAIILIISIHIISAFMKDNIAKILQFVNIGLHIALFLILILSDIPIDEAVLSYMISVFTYLLVGYIRHGRGGEGRV